MASGYDVVTAITYVSPFMALHALFTAFFSITIKTTKTKYFWSPEKTFLNKRQVFSLQRHHLLVHLSISNTCQPRTKPQSLTYQHRSCLAVSFNRVLSQKDHLFTVITSLKPPKKTKSKIFEFNQDLREFYCVSRNQNTT